MKMRDLPGVVYRCEDEKTAPAPYPPRANSHCVRLGALQVGETYTLPYSSSGIISRTAKKHGFVFKRNQIDNNQLLVRRVA